MNRDLFFDYTKGLLIFFVIFGHVISLKTDNGGFIYFFLYCFHMPLFAFISGYFSKSFYEQKLISYGIKQFKHLIRPHILWSTLALIVLNPLGIMNINFNMKSIYYLYTDIWFLWFIFTSSILTVIITKLTNKLYVYLIFSLFLILILVLYPNPIVNQFTIAYMYLFYVLGQIYKKYKDIYMNKIILFISSLIFLLLFYKYAFYYDLKFCSLSSTIRILLYTTGCYISLYLLKKTYRENRFAKLWEKIGQETLGIYIFQHVLLFWILSRLLNHELFLRINIYLYYIISFFVSLALTFALYYIVKFFKRFRILSFYI